MSPDFATPAGLRVLLTELHYAGPTAWCHDPEAAELMEYAARKYSALAHKHNLEPEDAAYAAFNILRTDAVRFARDPWAVVTRAVQIALIAEERANGLLCSSHQARRAQVSAHHDAERFSDRETSILEYHPAFHVPPDADALTDLADTASDEDHTTKSTVTTAQAFEMTAQLFVALNWPEQAIRHAIGYIAARLIQAGNRVTAHEGLRKDRLALVALDLTQPTWSTLLTVVLGSPHPDHEHTRIGHGIWWRLLLGEPPTSLLTDDELVRTISGAAPTLEVCSRVEKVLAHAG